MPAAQLLTAGLEKALNHLLSLDPAAASELGSLAGKQLRVKLQELPWPLIFAFSDRIHVLVQEDSEASPDCSLSLSLSTLQALQDPSQITRLIKDGKLDLEGDIHVAQGFSTVVKNLDIDWEEQLSKHTGDVVAHSLFSTGRRVFELVREKGEQVRKTLSEGALEEKRLAAHPIAVEHFNLSVNDLRSDTDRLEARLSNLEKRLAASQEADGDNETHSIN